jgi:hypothetical protein
MKCKEPGCEGEVELVRVGDCRCHISPPCRVCTNATRTCLECGKEYDDEPV